MGKTKAEIIAEYRDLKKENLKLTNTIHQLSRDEDARRAVLAQLKKDVARWKEMAQKENDRVVDLAHKLDESEKEKALIRSQRDNLLLEHEKMATEFGRIQDDLEILQSEVRKIQYDEEVTYHNAYEEGYSDAEHKFSQAIDNRDKEIEDLLDHCDIYWWILRSLHENATK